MDIKIILWIMTGLIIAISLYLVIIYIISKTFRSYPGYLNVILSLIIAVDNILRLIGIGEKGTIRCYFQAFFLAVFDKLIFVSLTINSFLTFIGVTNYELYIKNKKLLFIVSNIIGFLISFIFGIVFIFMGAPEPYENVCYVDSSDLKEITDTITTSCLYLIYLFCNIKLLLYLLRAIKELYMKDVKVNKYSKHFFRIFVSIIITSVAFLVVILIINDSLFLDENLIDLFYIIICLVVDLYYTFNMTVIQETAIIICNKKIENNDNEIDDEESSKNVDKNEKEEDNDDNDNDNEDIELKDK
jgi:hypothetical protein